MSAPSTVPLPLFSHYPAPAPPVKVRMLAMQPHACTYLPGRTSRFRGLMAGRMPGALYHQFMDAGFRRSGGFLYQPVCPGCRSCVSLRVPVARFAPSKSQRRARRRNTDLRVTMDTARATDEKFDLYVRYVTQWHGRSGEGEDPDDATSRESYEAFLYDSPVDTREFEYRDPDGRLLAVGICDLCPASLSSVYFYFDPAESRRGLGTFGAVYEIEIASRLNIPYYYLGFWVNGCGAMQYKATYRPCELLHPDGVWRPADASAELPEPGDEGL